MNGFRAKKTAIATNPASHGRAVLNAARRSHLFAEKCIRR
jgi:hypothetical protein